MANTDNSNNSIANTLDPIVEISQADTLDFFRLQFNTLANLVNISITDQDVANLDHRLAGGNLFFGNTFVMRGPSGSFAAGDITCNNIIMTGDITGTINYIADDDNSTMIKLDGADPLIDDETIKFYAGGIANGEVATMNSEVTIINTKLDLSGDANTAGTLYVNGPADIRGNTTFFGPVSLPQIAESNTAGLEGQIRLNTDTDVVQVYDTANGWANVAGDLGNLASVDLSTAPQNQEVLTWDGSKWIAQVVTPVGTSGIGDLADIDLATTAPQSGDRLRYDGTMFVPSQIQFDEIVDVDLFSLAPTDGQVLHFVAANNTWVPNTVANTSLKELNLSGNTVTAKRNDDSVITMDMSPLFQTITQFADVHTSGLTNASILIYDSDLAKWVAGQETAAANTSTASGALGSPTSAKANTVTYYRADGTFYDVNLTNLLTGIDKLGNVDSTGVTHHQVLQWESAESMWKPGDVVATNVDLSTNMLTELSDVDLPAVSALTDKYVLKWDATATKWTAQEDLNDPSLHGIGIMADVDTSNTASPTQDLYLRWNPTNSSWYADQWSANDVPELRHLPDVNIGYPYVDHPNHGQVLKWNSINLAWEPADDALTEIGTFGLDRLADVDIITTAPTDGQILKFESATGNFIPSDDTSYLAILDTVLLDAMNDVDTVTNGKDVGDVLRWDGTLWQAHTMPLAPNTVNDIPDVSSTAPTAGQILKYDGTEWQMADEYEYTLDLTSSSIFELSDVTMGSTPQVNSQLIWDGTAWVPQAVPVIPTELDDLSNVASTTPTTGQVLKWSGSDWYPEDEAGAGSVTDLNNHTIDELSDVLNYGSAQVNDVLTWNGTQWGAASAASTIDTKALQDVEENSTAVDEQVLAFNDSTSKYEPTNISSLLRAPVTTIASSTGSAGDKAGNIAMDANYLYLCTADYDGSSDIWKRISFAGAMALESGDNNW